MARPMTAAQTRAAMKKWKVPVREWPDWATRGRDPEHGPFSDVRGIMIHHTGSDAGQSNDYLDFLARRGREGLPGPLCNAATDMDGDLWLIAQGRANHAGRGSSSTLAKVTNENHPGYTHEIKPGPDGIDGNAHYYGNEVRYDGGQPMTAKARRSSLLWCAAICDFHGWSALSVIGHREHTSRKPDPGNNPMNRYRSDLAAILRAGPGGTTTPPKGTKPVTTTDPEDANEYAAHVHAKAAAESVRAALSRVEAEGQTIPEPPAVTGSGDAYFAHYWAKYAAARAARLDERLAELGYPK